MNLTAILAVTLSAVEVLSPAAGSNPATPKPVALVAEACEATNSAALSDQRTVTSPWGYTNTYYVNPGLNTLMCFGTGRLFNYFHTGCSVDAQQIHVTE
jgi:hypothetical protein